MHLWNILERVCSQDIPVMIIGNYNIIVVEDKKKVSHFLVNQESVILDYLLRRLDCVTFDLLELSGVTSSIDLQEFGID